MNATNNLELVVDGLTRKVYASKLVEDEFATVEIWNNSEHQSEFSFTREGGYKIERTITNVKVRNVSKLNPEHALQFEVQRTTVFVSGASRTDNASFSIPADMVALFMECLKERDV